MDAILFYWWSNIRVNSWKIILDFQPKVHLTFKLKFGHRGLNHPSGIYQKSDITSQNHGFAVSLNSCTKLHSCVKVIHFNLNDSTIAGIIHYSKPIFSVQYHPEASPGPHDSDYLFEYFINLIYLSKR